MKTKLVCILLVLCSFCALAQDSLQHAIEDVLTIGFGKTYVNDEYLSTLLYSGFTYNIDNEWWQLFRKHPDWSHVGELRLNGGMLYNTPYSNAITLLGVHAGWGAHYNYVPISHLTIRAGAIFDVDYAAKIVSRSVNKPYSMDLSLNLNLSAGVSYVFEAKHSSYRLSYMIRTPFLGCMFVPEMGQSYYEMLQTLHGTAHASSFHNKLALTHELTLDMRFKRSTWRVGVVHDFQKCNANSLNFSREQIRMVVGTVFDFCTFGGRNRAENVSSVW